MTATSFEAALKTIQSAVGKMGGVTKCEIGEPSRGYQSGMVLVVPMSGSVPETTLTNPRETHHVKLIRLEKAFQEPAVDTELKLEQWRAEVMEDINGDFTLGGNVAYILPTQTTWEWGHVTYETTLYRYVDISLNFRIDPAGTYTP